VGRLDDRLRILELAEKVRVLQDDGSRLIGKHPRD